jgi:glycosyltransferase involved in cell wall biosynthesis
MENKLRIGMVARSDESGLGRLCEEFYNHLPISKTLVLVHPQYQNYPEKYPNGIIAQRGNPTLDEIDEFLKDLDVVITFETAYNWSLFSKAREKGVKSILVPMYEFTQCPCPEEPDLYLCPSKIEYDIYSKIGNAVYLPIPIDTNKIKFQERKTAKTFVMNNGHGGALGRNGLKELLEAISLVKSDVKFLIRSQVYFEAPRDSRVEIQFGDLPFDELYSKGDVFVFPHKFDGLSMPIQEAMAAGLPIISTNFYPHNEYLSKELLFEPETMTKIQMGAIFRQIDAAIISPVKLAEKIDELANKDVSEFSKLNRKQIEKWSWTKLQPKYLELFNSLIK